MNLLFDEDTPEKLMQHFQPHFCTPINRTEFKGLKNGTLLPIVPEALRAIESIKPGETLYLYADDATETRDRRKGKGRFRKPQP